MTRKRLTGLMLEICGPLVVVAVWWMASANSTSLYFPPLATIVERFREVWIGPGFHEHVVPSVVRMLSGYTIGVVAGIALGLVIGVSVWARRLLGPGIEFVRALPAVVLVPLALILFGAGAPMQVFVIALGCSFPVVLNTVAGVRAAEPVMLDVARSFQFSRWERLSRVVLPGATPSIFAGLKAALALALILMVVGEMVGSTNGIGYSILQSQRMFVVADMWAGLVMLGILGYVVNLALAGLEHLTLHWHRGLKASTQDA
jgi:ABC-type nitrate/sulfonate/bicarbonate transport system permease component